MFKKFKDKLAEEVKSSPQRIQQFAQAAQAAVTSASSSISDITNNDLFSIGDNDSTKVPAKPMNSQRDSIVPLSEQSMMQASNSDFNDFNNGNHDILENQRQRRLSNSSFASDISFKLPSYESPSVYHLQSDMDVSASEAEERGIPSISLDRVTKEQIYAAYRRTQERYSKYRSQYADLARHYKLLERENAKARSVLVETQDKALRRISELREQCSLEQSAKAHLERALRIEIDERNMKINALEKNIDLLQNNSEKVDNSEVKLDNAPLVDLSPTVEITPKEPQITEISMLNNKIEKMEQLLTKYKETMKSLKEKNGQLTTELKVMTTELETKNKENEQFSAMSKQLTEASQKIQELNETNEELQNKINSYDFSKTKQMSALEVDLEKATEEITQLKSKIEIFTKREEEYAISLAENKLSIHKELESKEAEIKSLKDAIATSQNEIQSLTIVVNDYKNNISLLEAERSKLNYEINQNNTDKNKLPAMESEINSLKQKCQNLEQMISKSEEEYKCLEIQVKQETAEKLAILDRNAYLENRNKQISEDNAKKVTQLTSLEGELKLLKNATQNSEENTVSERNELLLEVTQWKEKYECLESEIQEERVELVKLQKEIEKLLVNYELVQTENSNLNGSLEQLKQGNKHMQNDLTKTKANMEKMYIEFNKHTKELQDYNNDIKNTLQTYKNVFNDNMKCKEILSDMLNGLVQSNEMAINKDEFETLQQNYNKLEIDMSNLTKNYRQIEQENNTLTDENNKLNDTHETDKNCLMAESQKHEDLVKQYSNDIESLRSEKASLTQKLKELEENNLKIEKELEDLYIKYDQNLKCVKEQETISKIANEDVNNLKTQLDEFAKMNEERTAYTTTLETNLNEAKNQIISLKTEFETMAQNFKSLENELAVVRNAHSDIVVEKNHLNSIIEIMEKKEEQRPVIDSHREIQTDMDWEHQLNSLSEDNNTLKNKCEQIKQEKEELHEKVMALENKISEMDKKSAEQQDALNGFNELNKRFCELKIVNQNCEKEILNLQNTKVELTDKLNYELRRVSESVYDECESLTSDNKRLKSDIEGLQCYLTKISKENCLLNDKLRDILASSAQVETNDNNEFKQEIADLKSAIEKEKEKNDDLTRQNNLLAEENLELKDQIQNSNPYPKPIVEDKTDNVEIQQLQDNFNELMLSKNELENKLEELHMVNKSSHNNLKQVQESNHKLRSTNEKLERRLDEALVSLRHLHSLQENTELEYLRNILYEYLTGSGSHSETLAKVLAAVVKFDDKQTQTVLQKEKERQGLLRQLGLL